LFSCRWTQLIEVYPADVSRALRPSYLCSQIFVYLITVLLISALLKVDRQETARRSHFHTETNPNKESKSWSDLGWTTS